MLACLRRILSMKWSVRLLRRKQDIYHLLFFVCIAHKPVLIAFFYCRFLEYALKKPFKLVLYAKKDSKAIESTHLKYKKADKKNSISFFMASAPPHSSTLNERVTHAFVSRHGEPAGSPRVVESMLILSPNTLVALKSCTVYGCRA